MHRSALTTAGILAVGVCAHAQRPAGAALPAVGVKHAGKYHLATGTWTRGAADARAWNDNLFDNTCTVGAYSPHVSTDRYVDDGRIPQQLLPENPGPPASAISWTGTKDAYQVTEVEIGYCTFEPLPTYELNFWECFTGCQDATLLTPTAGFRLTNMPGAGGTGMACWTVGISLVNSGLRFRMNADCDGVWNGGGGADTFGWSGQHVTPSTGGTPGPLIAGDPLGYLNGGPGSSGCEFGAGTMFYNGAFPTAEGTGLSGLDQWEVDTMTPTPVYTTCYWYGGYSNGNLYGSFHLRIGGPACLCAWEPGYPYCPGDGSGSPCPFNNNNDGSESPGGGCYWGNANFPGGGVLSGFGHADLGQPDAILIATSVENDFGIFFGAANRTNGGAGNPLNDGLRCAGGGLIRLTPPTPATGNVASHGPVELSDSGAAPGVTRRYQYWFRTPNGPGGTMANLTNGYEITWY